MSQTHFGFQTVDENKKETLVRGVFDNVANRYDLMNDVMSGGLHRLWKREMVSTLAPRAGQKILDVAGGTGDIAFRILKEIEGKRPEALGQSEEAITHASCPMPHASITICDINQSMVNEGKNRAIDSNQRERLQWTCGNAESLPFPDNYFDAYTIAFGIRNVTHIDKALAEAHRVLKIGGRFLCLEFSHVQGEMLSKIYSAYSFNIIPWMGEKITQDRASYQYLVESIRQFPAQEKFIEMISAAGFGNVTYRNMTGGVVALHSGRKL